MIDIKGVRIGFENKIVLNNFSEHIAPREHVCIMGKSGSGKSSLLRSLVGFNLPLEGRITVDGLPMDADHVGEIRTHTAWLPQEVNLPYTTVREAMQAPYMLKVNKHLSFDKVRMLDLFAQLGLDAKIYNQRMDEISGGERQRLMQVSALMLDRKIMLLDEPTSALDAGTRSQLSAVLQSLTDATIVAVTHDAEFAATFDRTIIVNKD